MLYEGAIFFKNFNENVYLFYYVWINFDITEVLKKAVTVVTLENIVFIF